MASTTALPPFSAEAKAVVRPVATIFLSLVLTVSSALPA
jgi:hypothetical protein